MYYEGGGRGYQEAYFALEDAEAALKRVHNGVVNAFPVVNDFVFVNTGNKKEGTIVYACLGDTVLLCFFSVPACRCRSCFLRLGDVSEELDMTRREQIPTTIDVDNLLAGLDAFTLDELVKSALFFLDRALWGGG